MTKKYQEGKEQEGHSSALSFPAAAGLLGCEAICKWKESAYVHKTWYFPQ
jgi:hypothetical protein